MTDKKIRHLPWQIETTIITIIVLSVVIAGSEIWISLSNDLEYIAPRTNPEPRIISPVSFFQPTCGNVFSNPPLNKKLFTTIIPTYTLTPPATSIVMTSFFPRSIPGCFLKNPSLRNDGKAVTLLLGPSV